MKLLYTSWLLLLASTFVVLSGRALGQCPAPVVVGTTPGQCGALVNYTAEAFDTLAFDYTGAPQTWVVPANVTSITALTYGAQGADSYTSGAPGGLMKARFLVTPGETLTIYVGGHGGVTAGGYNGGGNGSLGYFSRASGGGGGASDIRRGGATLNERILVGGGGGGSGAGPGYPPSMQGGRGGGLNGGAGGNGSAGGSQTAPGGNGDFGLGGRSQVGDGGGGGGGGWYGGAAGLYQYGGGGGSGYAAPSGTLLAAENGARWGNGLVYILIPAATRQTAGLPSGSLFPVGVTENAFSFTHSYGRTSSCSFTVTVNDLAPPSFVPALAVPVSISQLGRTSTYSNINLNGTGTNVARVSAGTSVSLSYNRNTTVDPGAGGCPSCLTQHYVGIAGGSFSTCHFIGTGASSSTENYTFTAPAVPGIYYINQSASWDIGCVANPQFTAGYGDNTIAVLVVEKATINTDAGACGAVVHFPALTAFDFCSPATVTQVAGKPSGSLFPAGATTNTFEATDAAGNKATFSFTITVRDTEAPVVADLPSVTAECSTTVAPITGTDNCAGTVTPTTSDPLTYTAQGTYTIRWTYSDGNGNNTIKEQTVTIKDVTKPVADAATLPDITGACSVTITDKPTATDNCAGTITATTSAPLSYSEQGTYTITWTYDDGNGNLTTQEQKVIVKDTTPPSFTIAAAQNVSLGTGCQFAVPDLIAGLTGTDNCSSTVTFTQAPLAGALVASGHNQTHTVTITAADGNNNIFKQEVVLTAQDDSKPQLTAPAALTVNTDAGKCSASGVTLGVPTATDNCEGVTVTSDAPAVYPTGSTTITWMATDAAGNRATATQMVTVVDREAPVVADLPAVTAECSTTVAPITGTDNCAGVIVPTTTDPLSYAAQGTYTIRWTYSDGNGNNTIKEQTVTIKDAAKPVPTVSALPDLTAECSVAVTTKPIATDNCAAIITGSTSDPLTYAAAGTYTITWSYNDGNGNVAMQMQKVIIKDAIKPKITAPAARTVSVDRGKCSASSVQLGSPTVSDNCGAVTVTNNAPAVFTKGITTVTWTVTDKAGNKATATQSVTVLDTEKPVIKLPVMPGVLCTDPKGVYNIAPLQASDNCGFILASYAITGATNRIGIGLNASGFFQAGTSTITWAAIDASGNISTGQTKVVVNPSILVSIPDAAALSKGVEANTVYLGYSPAGALTLTASVRGGTGPYTYRWSTGATTASIKVSPTAATTTYTVTITDAKGCTGKATKLVRVVDVRCGNGGSKVSVWHKGNSLCIGKESVADHLAHGDYLGSRKPGNFLTQAERNDRMLVEKPEVGRLSVTAAPNPSTTYFTIHVNSNSNAKVKVRVTDALGRLIEERNGVVPGGTLQIGSSYRPGLYFVQVLQEEQSLTVKLVKGSQ